MKLFQKWITIGNRTDRVFIVNQQLINAKAKNPKNKLWSGCSQAKKSEDPKMSTKNSRPLNFSFKLSVKKNNARKSI